MSWMRLLVSLALLCVFWAAPVPSSSGEVPLYLQVPLTIESAQFLKAITLKNPDDDRFDAETLVRKGTTAPVVIDLGLGDQPHKAVLLMPHATGPVFRVTQQFETSLSLMDEGPHMDLRDWRHHVSSWQELPSADGLTFHAIEIASEAFPAVTREEIVTAVREESLRWVGKGHDPGARWTTLAGRCTSPTTYPCGVSVSKVRLRVQVAEDGDLRTLQEIEIIVPMGC